MHGLGNDFVLLDAISQNISLTAEQICRLGHRKYGIGFDQLLMVEAPSSPKVDFRYRIFNSDGFEVEQCGNGARCFAQFVLRQGLTEKTFLRVETLAGELTLQVHDESDVTVDMGTPLFAPQEIPFSAESSADRYMLDVDGEAVEISVTNIGNPHAVLFVDDVSAARVQELGAKIEVHARFPNRTNVQFVQIENEHTIRQRVFERGVGETAASGSGACAGFAVAQRLNLIKEVVDVHMPGGVLNIRRNNNGSLLMRGPTEYSFEGSFIL